MSNTPTDHEDSAEQYQRIAKLNDGFRRSGGLGGRFVMTPGVQALGPIHVAKLCRLVIRFDAFTEDNDPYGEHDFGSIEYGGRKFFWKIDAYDKALEFGSPDPTDPAVTTRVLTLMLAQEY